MVLAGLLVVLAATSSIPVPLDSVAVVARARALHPFVSAGDAGALWKRFDDSMPVAVFVNRVVDGQEVECGEIVRGQTVRRKGTK